MKKLTAPGIQTTVFSVREARSLGLWMRLTPGLLIALATSSLLVACGSDVIDIRTDGTSDSGSTGAGGDACAAIDCTMPPPPTCVEMCNGVVSPVMVSTGNRFACAVTSTGAVKCWGRNHTGELGNDSTTNSPVPVDVVGLSSGILAVSAGGAHACAIIATGAVKCWGQNFTGPLGNDSTTDSRVPVDVVGLSSGVLSISAGSLHTCAVTKAGAVKCWGHNDGGQLGNNSTTGSLVPVDVVGLSSGVLSVSAGWGHTCALTSTGAVKCWGQNLAGELGHGSMDEKSTVPVDVVGLSSGVLAVSAGFHDTCTVTALGSVECWGDNEHGQLGNDATSDSRVPVEVGSL